MMAQIHSIRKEELGPIETSMELGPFWIKLTFVIHFHVGKYVFSHILNTPGIFKKNISFNVHFLIDTVSFSKL